MRRSVALRPSVETECAVGHLRGSRCPLLLQPSAALMNLPSEGREVPRDRNTWKHDGAT